VQWPAGVGAKGNEGVSGLVKQTPGAIGYVELIYAAQNNIAFGSVQNKAGEFVTASLQSVTTAAASTAQSMPEDFRVSITNADGKGAYPVASFTWLLFYQNPQDKQSARAMVDFMKWALTDGQQLASQLGYASLPQAVVYKEMQALGKIQL
jgi:phosphate transport system substrate-binding protein